MLIVVARILKTYQTIYVQIDEWIQIQTGAFSTELFLTKRAKVDELEVDQSWIEQKLGLASIRITTRAKPIHVSHLEHLPKETAFTFYRWYKQGTTSSGSKQVDT